MADVNVWLRVPRQDCWHWQAPKARQKSQEHPEQEKAHAKFSEINIIRKELVPIRKEARADQVGAHSPLETAESGSFERSSSRMRC